MYIYDMAHGQDYSCKIILKPAQNPSALKFDRENSNIYIQLSNINGNSGYVPYK